jgi:hypothetical protein
MKIKRNGNTIIVISHEWSLVIERVFMVIKTIVKCMSHQFLGPLKQVSNRIQFNPILLFNLLINKFNQNFITRKIKLLIMFLKL